LTCACGANVEIPTTPPHQCPHCGRALTIHWGRSNGTRPEVLLRRAERD
jgi:hypothetical protein